MYWTLEILHSKHVMLRFESDSYMITDYDLGSLIV
jgi:hypothetical protein